MIINGNLDKKFVYELEYNTIGINPLIECGLANTALLKLQQPEKAKDINRLIENVLI